MEAALHPWMAFTTVWIAKYAITKGIIEGQIQGTLADSQLTAGKYYVVHITSSSGRKYTMALVPNKDFYLSREAAVERANILVTNKINSLQKQLKRLEQLTIQ